MSVRKLNETQLLRTPPDEIIEKDDLIRDRQQYQFRIVALQKVLNETNANLKLFEVKE